MNTTFDHTIEKLTRPWSDTHTVEGEYVTVQYEPLLDMLKGAVSSSLGRTAGGRTSPEASNPFNIPAFDLWERVDGQVRAWLGEFGVQAPRELKKAVVTLHRTVLDLWAGARIQETLFLRIQGMTQRWVEQVWELFHPPTGVPLDGACPECEARWVINVEGAQMRALVASTVGGDPVVVCRAGCGFQVGGMKAALELARRIGASPDVDTIHNLNDGKEDR